MKFSTLGAKKMVFWLRNWNTHLSSTVGYLEWRQFKILNTERLSFIFQWRCFYLLITLKITKLSEKCLKWILNFSILTSTKIGSNWVLHSQCSMNISLVKNRFGFLTSIFYPLTFNSFATGLGKIFKQLMMLWLCKNRRYMNEILQRSGKTSNRYSLDTQNTFIHNWLTEIYSWEFSLKYAPAVLAGDYHVPQWSPWLTTLIIPMEHVLMRLSM